ncbi:hypothetical protein ACFC1R_37320 [Kitasatospora sp. NPDC056138]|uniref:hypothetical protein n=1 Tax=Kitasatospora sp. NPDC056138 TaxID=3345724 RepID=UPI0035DB9870
MDGLDRKLAAGAMVTVLVIGGAVLSGCGGGADPAADPLTHPCLLLSASQAEALLHRSPGSGEEVTQSEVSECAYQDVGLFVAVARASYSRKSFQEVVDGTKGRAMKETGLGDAAYSFHVQDESGDFVLLDVLKGRRLVQITAPSVDVGRQAAGLVLPRVR